MLDVRAVGVERHVDARVAGREVAAVAEPPNVGQRVGDRDAVEVRRRPCAGRCRRRWPGRRALSGCRAAGLRDAADGDRSAPACRRPSCRRGRRRAPAGPPPAQPPGVTAALAAPGRRSRRARAGDVTSTTGRRRRRRWLVGLDRTLSRAVAEYVDVAGSTPATRRCRRTVRARPGGRPRRSASRWPCRRSATLPARDRRAVPPAVRAACQRVVAAVAVRRRTLVPANASPRRLTVGAVARPQPDLIGRRCALAGTPRAAAATPEHRKLLYATD